MFTLRRAINPPRFAPSLLSQSHLLPYLAHSATTIRLRRSMTSVKKSDGEWKAILSPEQVSCIQERWRTSRTNRDGITSSVSFARRALNLLAPASTISTVQMVSTPAQGVELPCTRARPSSIADADGLPSLTVRIVTMCPENYC